jgi:hypothetical protein
VFVRERYASCPFRPAIVQVHQAIAVTNASVSDSWQYASSSTFLAEVLVANENQRGYATNLASEFYVLSSLYRLGLAANLTLGNKKGIDIVVACDPGKAFTIEVKAVAGKMDWLVGQLGMTRKDHHFVVLVCYEGAFDNPESAPKVWVFRHDDLIRFIKTSKTGTARYISRKEIREAASKNAQNWALLRDAAC